MSRKEDTAKVKDFFKNQIEVEQENVNNIITPTSLNEIVSKAVWHDLPSTYEMIFDPVAKQISYKEYINDLYLSKKYFAIRTKRKWKVDSTTPFPYLRKNGVDILIGFKSSKPINFSIANESILRNVTNITFDCPILVAPAMYTDIDFHAAPKSPFEIEVEYVTILDEAAINKLCSQSNKIQIWKPLTVLDYSFFIYRGQMINAMAKDFIF